MHMDAPVNTPHPCCTPPPYGMHPSPHPPLTQMLVEAEDFERHLATFEGAARRYHDVVQREWGWEGQEEGMKEEGEERRGGAGRL